MVFTEIRKYLLRDMGNSIRKGLLLPKIRNAEKLVEAKHNAKLDLAFIRRVFKLIGIMFQPYIIVNLQFWTLVVSLIGKYN